MLPQSGLWSKDGSCALSLTFGRGIPLAGTRGPGSCAEMHLNDSPLRHGPLWSTKAKIDLRRKGSRNRRWGNNLDESGPSVMVSIQAAIGLCGLHDVRFKRTSVMVIGRLVVTIETRTPERPNWVA